MQSIFSIVTYLGQKNWQKSGNPIYLTHTFIYTQPTMRKSIILQTLVILSIIGVASANLQIQTNIENATQTIRQIFITSNGLQANSNNTLMSINADNQWTVFIQNTLQTQWNVMFNWLQNNNNPDSIVTIQNNGTLQKTPINQIWWGEGPWQREETETTLSTNKNVGIGHTSENMKLRVEWNTLFSDNEESIYIFPNNSFSSSRWWITSTQWHLKINTANNRNLYINHDISGNTIIKWMLWVHYQSDNINPTAAVDIKTPSGHEQLRLRTQFTPKWQYDEDGEIGSISWWIKEGVYYIYIKTPDGRHAAAMQPLDPIEL